MSKPTTSTYTSHSEQETRNIAAQFAASLQGSEKICLVGPLGSGKTTFVRGFAQALGIPSHDVQSPTFTLVRQYERPDGATVYHVDLYRLDREEEIIEAGILELLGSDELVIVEWADRLKVYAPEPCIRIEFAHGDKEGVRTITISP